MAKTKNIVIMRVEDFKTPARLKSERNVRIWGKKGWVNIVDYDGKQYVVMDEKAKAILETRLKLPVGGSSRLLWKKPPKVTVVKKPKKSAKVVSGTMTIDQLEKFFGVSNQELAENISDHLNEVESVQGKRQFTRESAHAYKAAHSSRK